MPTTKSESTKSKTVSLDEPAPRSANILRPKEETEYLDVELAVDNDNARYDVERLVSYLGGKVTASKGTSLTVECPPVSERNTGDARTKLANGLATSPLVESVEVA